MGPGGTNPLARPVLGPVMSMASLREGVLKGRTVYIK